MLDYLLAAIVIFLLLLGWVTVQQISRRFARRHPEFGPAQEEGGGCTHSCLCQFSQCADHNTDLKIPGDEYDPLERLR
jgi:hypothetical protein